MPERKVILIIRDGWGYSEETKGNATRLANTPNSDRYEREYPRTLLKCSGNAVGLPDGTQGGSEPGHLTIGAGRIVWQPYEDINRKIKNGEFYENKDLLNAVENCKKHNSSLHLMGLFSDEGVHGTTEHLYALLELAKRNKLDGVYIHAFLDGRDVPEKSAAGFFTQCEQRIKEIGVGQVASIAGRYYAMDRDTNWDRTQKAYDMLTKGEGYNEENPYTALENAYKRGDATDYYVQPIVITGADGKPIASIKDNDSIIFWNFRSDRTRQLTYALTQDKFDKFNRKSYPKTYFAGMSEYDKHLRLPAAFPPQNVENNLGQVLSKNNLKQLRIAETEKYAHVTFFFNSQVEDPNPGEDRMMIPSPKVPSYAEKPEMSAYEITDKLLEQIQRDYYDFIAVNFANGDLVGHSANLKAGVKACEVVDDCVGKIVELGLEHEYIILITGDHGNVEIMFYPDGEPCPAHGTNPVPFMLIGKGLENVKLTGDGLDSIAPTILELMELEKPEDMAGVSLLR